jgi:hypothetical protein
MSEQVLVQMQGGPCQLCDAPDRPADVTIQGSVGRGGRNRPDDIRTIQSAPNGQAAAAGGPSAKLAVDGVSGPLTILPRAPRDRQAPTGFVQQILSRR